MATKVTKRGELILKRGARELVSYTRGVAGPCAKNFITFVAPWTRTLAWTPTVLRWSPWGVPNPTRFLPIRVTGYMAPLENGMIAAGGHLVGIDACSPLPETFDARFSSIDLGPSRRSRADDANAMTRGT